MRIGGVGLCWHSRDSIIGQFMCSAADYSGLCRHSRSSNRQRISKGMTPFYQALLLIWHSVQCNKPICQQRDLQKDT